MPRSRTRKQVVRRTKRTMRKSRSTRRRSMRGGKCCGSGNCGHNKQGGARNHNKEHGHGHGHGHQHGGQCGARKNQGGGNGCGGAPKKSQNGGRIGNHPHPKAHPRR